MRTLLLAFSIGLPGLAASGVLQQSPRLQTTPSHSTTKPTTSLSTATVSLPPSSRSLPPTTVPPPTASPETTVSGEATANPAVLAYAEQMPTFAGGELALHRYLAANTLYPAEAVRAGLSGTVVMQFVIDEQGRVLNPVVVKSSNPAFNAEATRLMWLMPWWNPGRQQGQLVRVRYTLPIVFSFKRAS